MCVTHRWSDMQAPMWCGSGCMRLCGVGLDEWGVGRSTCGPTGGHAPMCVTHLGAAQPGDVTTSQGVRVVAKT